MVFTTQVFLFYFFPICITGYILIEKLEVCNICPFLNKIRAKDILLIVFSLGFYMWACFDDVLRLVVFIILVYILALWIQTSGQKKLFLDIKKECSNNNSIIYKRFYINVIPFILSVSLVIFFLIYFNYSSLVAYIWNMLFRDSVASKSLLAPLGLSFITFSAVSYLSDIYSGNATTGSIIDCALYLSFFPKIASGPIILWQNFQGQIKNRKSTSEISTDGLNRIIIGFAKKLILADTFGSCLAKISLQGIDRITAVGTLILYMMQIYYDFSGYSDIAIGLSKLFGFEFKDNFNFPYRSKSISEFWRRWHISLGAWFRQYIYIPLGGNRADMYKTLRNLAIVFALTGIWHGAGWNYILWGCINGTLVILERIIQNKPFYQKTPGPIKYAGTMLIVMLFWQLFRFQNLSDIVNLFGVILGTIQFDKIFYTWQYYFDNSIIILTILGIVGATWLGNPKILKQYNKIASTKVGYTIQETALLILFVLSILYMVNSTYSPFIYFQY